MPSDQFLTAQVIVGTGALVIGILSFIRGRVEMGRVEMGGEGDDDITVIVGWPAKAISIFFIGCGCLSFFNIWGVYLIVLFFIFSLIFSSFRWFFY